MRSLFVPVLLFLAAALPAGAADVRIKRVWPEWFEGDSFQSYYENHTGRELTGKWVILRSSPSDRTGLYFLTRVENTGTPLLGSTFVLSVVPPDSTDVRVFTFPAAVASGSHLFELALTGKDWTVPKTQPVAWKVELRSADGSVIAEVASFLWEKPSR